MDSKFRDIKSEIGFVDSSSLHPSRAHHVFDVSLPPRKFVCQSLASYTQLENNEESAARQGE